MKARRTTIAAIAAVVLSLAVATPATAAPADRELAAKTAHVQAIAAAITANPAIASNVTNIVISWWDSGQLGVIRGGSTTTTFDKKLPIEDPTQAWDADNTADKLGWTTAGGWYVGSGYCTEVWRSDNGVGGPYNHVTTLYGAGQHRIGSHTSYIVEVHHWAC